MISFSQLGNMGRLGNQMFQIAATESHANKVKTEAVFPEWQYSQHFNHTFKHGMSYNQSFHEAQFNFQEIPVVDVYSFRTILH